MVSYQKDRAEVERQTQLIDLIASSQNEIHEKEQIERLLQQRMLQLEDMYRLTLRMTAELDVQNVLDMIVENGLKILGGDDGGCFYMMNGKKHLP